MQEYLIKDCKVDTCHILLESTAYHTLDNIIEAKAILDKNNLQPKKLIIITHDWHMERAKALAIKIYEDTKIELIFEPVITIEQTPEVIDRIKKEKRLVEVWVPSVLNDENYMSHPQFPKLPD